MKKIDYSKLHKGDIILTTSTLPQSKAIRKFTKSDISHAMIYVANGSVMDSTSEGVHARNLQRLVYDDACAIYAYRTKDAISPEKIDQIISYVRSETGAPYATLDAMRSPFKPSRRASSAQFCSRLIARAYANAGFPLTTNPDYTTPADLQRSVKLKSIPNIELYVTPEEKDELEADDTLSGMRRVTNDLLNQVRVISPEIRVLNDITRTLLENPSLDSEMATAYLSSGYLDYWKVEIEKHPYRYDLNKMINLYNSTAEKEGIINYCHTTLQDHPPEHWKTNLDTYANLLKNNPLETFKLNHNLYENLCKNHGRRINVAHNLLLIHKNNEVE